MKGDLRKYAVDKALGSHANDWMRRGCVDAACEADAVEFLKRHLRYWGCGGPEKPWLNGGVKGVEIQEPLGTTIAVVTWLELAQIARGKQTEQLELF